MVNQDVNKGWNLAQKLNWFAKISHQQRRDYQSDVVNRLTRLPANTHILERYGALSLDDERYPLLNVTVGDVQNGNPNILLTGGVHGYEPSGVEAILSFLENDAVRLSNTFNFVAYPCISPWSYEFDHRWNAYAEDPNRHFSRLREVRQLDECVHFMNSVESKKLRFAVAMDMHETPDRDIELRQERASRFGTELESYWQSVPQGFYLMMTLPESNALGARAKLGASIIEEVRQVSPIAPEANVIGYENRDGVLWAPNKGNVLRVYLGRHAEHVAVTEVYPDHKDVGKQGAVETQLAALRGALKFAAR